jgi:hypothetical protein
MRAMHQVPIGYVTHKSGVSFDDIAPGGFALLAGIHHAAATLRIKLVITSGTDGRHSGPSDPHYQGKAYDISIADYSLNEIDEILDAMAAVLPAESFTLLLESPVALLGGRHPVVLNPQATAPHLHLQVRRGTVYPAILSAPEAPRA